MFRRSVLASVPVWPAAAVLVTAALALSGCKVEASAGGSPTGGATPDGPAVATAAGQGPAPASGTSGALVVEPRAGFSAVYSLISHARNSVDLTMYELADTTAEGDLAAAAQRGVNVRVVLDSKEKRSNAAAYRYLGSHGVRVVWSSARYEYTHQKTVVADGSQAIIMTANLTSRYYPTSRDFLVLDSSRADVGAIVSVFNADFAHRTVTPGDGQDLVWSPAGSQGKLLGLINGATRSLRIYSEEMGDTAVENALIKAAKRGVDVQVCGENTSGEYDRAYARLAGGGVHVSYYSSADGFYIHGKVVEADYGTARAKVFIGSENFSSTSLNRNRELGLIISSGPVMSSIASTFAADFQHGQHRS